MQKHPVPIHVFSPVTIAQMHTSTNHVHILVNAIFTPLSTLSRLLDLVYWTLGRGAGDGVNMGRLFNLNSLIAGYSTEVTSQASTRKADGTESTTKVEDTSHHTFPDFPIISTHTSTSSSTTSVWKEETRMTTEKSHTNTDQNTAPRNDVFRTLFASVVPIILVILIIVVIIFLRMYFKSREIRLARDELITLQLAQFESEL